MACEIATRVFNVNRCIARVNNPKNRRIFREVGIESVSSTMLIANMIEEEALMGGVGVVSALSRGDIALLEIAIPQKLRHFKMDDGVPVDVIDLPEGSLLIAVDRREYGEAEVATDDMVLYPAIRPSWSPSTISSTMFARYSALCKPLLRELSAI